MKTEEEFFYDLGKKPNGNKAVAQMQKLDPTQYDIEDLTVAYQSILTKNNVRVSISDLDIDEDGNVSLKYK